MVKTRFLHLNLNKTAPVGSLNVYNSTRQNCENNFISFLLLGLEKNVVDH